MYLTVLTLVNNIVLKIAEQILTVTTKNRYEVIVYYVARYSHSRAHWCALPPPIHLWFSFTWSLYLVLCRQAVLAVILLPQLPESWNCGILGVSLHTTTSVLGSKLCAVFTMGLSFEIPDTQFWFSKQLSCPLLLSVSAFPWFGIALFTLCPKPE